MRAIADRRSRSRRRGRAARGTTSPPVTSNVLAAALPDLEQAEPRAEAVQRQPDRDQRREQHGDSREQDAASARRFAAPARAARARSTSRRARASRSPPRLRARPVGAAEDWSDRERERADSGDEEAGGEQQSSNRPSTEKRTPARIATIVAASTTAVSSTSRPSGSSYVFRRIGLVRKSAVADPSRATSSISPTSHDSNVSLTFLCTSP